MTKAEPGTTVLGRLVLKPALALGMFVPTVAAADEAAKDNGGFDADLSVTAVTAKRTIAEGDDLDSTGAGVRVEFGYEQDLGKTELRAETSAAAFDYRDDTRETRWSYGGQARLRHHISKTVAFEVTAGHMQNIAVLEADRADQTQVRGAIVWNKGDHFFDVSATWRQRDYDDAVVAAAPPAGTVGSSAPVAASSATRSKGVRLGARYRHHFATRQWLTAQISHEDLNSDNTRRGYARTIAAIDYTQPIGKKSLRLLFGLEARWWQYEGRRVGDVATGPLRRDSMVAPEFGLAYGRAKGFYARGAASYQFRHSNDPRYDGNGPRAQVSVGYKF